ncbi:MAG: hypothetical protein ACK40U_03410, partial [Fervidobacterium pennivorans]
PSTSSTTETRIEILNKVFDGLLSLIGHKYPIVRRGIADDMYLWSMENNKERIMDILLSTSWDSDEAYEKIEELKEIIKEDVIDMV